MAAAIAWSVCEEIIASEVARLDGALPGYGSDDLAQECRIAVARASKRLEPGRGMRSYLRMTARNRLITLLTQQRTQRRCPHDAHGRPKPYAMTEMFDIPAHQASAEVVVESRQAVAYLRERLDPRDWDALVATFIEGARIVTGRNDGRHAFSLVRARATAILQRIGYRVCREQESDSMSAETIPQTKPEDLPECHADGEEPIGYDVADYDCVQCRDKFTCLPSAISKKLQPIDLAADLEVAAVHGGHMTYDVALQRMLRRHHQIRGKEEVAVEDGHNFPGLLPDGSSGLPQPATPSPELSPASAAHEDAGAEAEGEAAPEVAPSPKKKLKQAPPPSTPEDAPLLTVEARGTAKFLVLVDGTRKGRVEQYEDGWGWWTRHEESPEWLPSFAKALSGVVAELRDSAPKLQVDKTARSAHKNALDAQAAKPPRGASRRAPEGWPRMRDKRPYPTPKQLTKTEMDAKLADAQSRLGANIVLEYGMQLVRRTRKGEVVARITPEGFEYDIPHADLVAKAGLDSPTQTFGSLSAVAMWFEGRLRTGNDFFNVAKHACTEIRSADHRIIDRKGGAPGL